MEKNLMRKPKIFIPLITVLIVFCAALSGCGREVSSVEYRKIVGMALPGSDDDSAVTGMARILETKISGDDVWVDFELAGEVSEAQIFQLRNMIANHTDIIVISYVEGVEEDDVIVSLRAANIPIVLIDPAAAETDPEQEAERLAQEVNRFLKEMQ